ncbi:MAG: 3-deoxy-manno-octulosonate cytidylyltransferase [Cellvibrionaceae bacterium]
MSSRFVVVIPARFSSSRLPGKILLPVNGKPMVQHVYERAVKSSASQVVIAADDKKIVDAVKKFGGNVVLTSTDHQSGTDRLEEAANILKMSDNDIVVNVQGDEPLIPPAVIDQVAENLAKDEACSVATLCEKINCSDVFLDPNSVKVIKDVDSRAIYFSRAPIPFPRDEMDGLTFLKKEINPHVFENTFRHIGIYGYRVSLLRQFVGWPMAPLESIEKLEQLRVLYNGKKIHVEEACEMVPAGVDTDNDLERVKKIIAS